MKLKGRSTYQITQRLPAGGTLTLTVRKGQGVPPAWREHVPAADHDLFANVPSADVSEKRSEPASGEDPGDDESPSTKSTRPRRKRK